MRICEGSNLVQLYLMFVDFDVCMLRLAIMVRNVIGFSSFYRFTSLYNHAV